MKNPRHVAFVRQANMGNNLQVNNGTPPAALPSRAEINDISPNKLLEADNGQRLDARATGTAGGANREMEAVGAVNRTKVGER